MGWWSELSLGVMTSSGDLAFLDARLPAGPAAFASVPAEEISTAFQGFGGDGGGGAARAAWSPRPPPLGPRCTVWFAGDGRRAAVCWPGAGGGGGRWGGGGAGAGGMAGVRSTGAGGSVVGLLSLGTAEEAVEGRVRRGLLGEALDLAVSFCGDGVGGMGEGLFFFVMYCVLVFVGCFWMQLVPPFFFSPTCCFGFVLETVSTYRGSMKHFCYEYKHEARAFQVLVCLQLGSRLDRLLFLAKLTNT